MRLNGWWRVRRGSPFSGRGGTLRDEPRAALIGQVSPKPLHADPQPLFEPDKQVDVHQRPQHPGEPALELPCAEIEHGRTAANDGCVTAVAEAEGRDRRPPQQAGGECHTEVAPLLLRNLG